MGVLYDYFAAPSDATAAEMAMRQGGPGAPVPASPALREALRTRDREALRLALRPSVRMSDSGVLVLETKGIDPLVQMGTLEALLTGEQYDVIVGRPLAGHLVAERSKDGPWVTTLTDELQAALVAASQDQIVAVAAPWLATEEFRGQGDPEGLADFLLALADLARQAMQRGERLYCWSCL
ncbi:MAG: hypothetical protein J2P29_01400 [Actinobacteria bacterium]|nr:hypothetical protein [Actinomycetota bacterium]